MTSFVWTRNVPEDSLITSPERGRKSTANAVAFTVRTRLVVWLGVVTKIIVLTTIPGLGSSWRGLQHFACKFMMTLISGMQIPSCISCSTWTDVMVVIAGLFHLFENVCLRSEYTVFLHSWSYFFMWFSQWARISWCNIFKYGAIICLYFGKLTYVKYTLVVFCHHGSWREFHNAIFFNMAQ
jgi:hypothetical protein